MSVDSDGDDVSRMIQMAGTNHETTARFEVRLKSQLLKNRTSETSMGLQIILAFVKRYIPGFAIIEVRNFDYFCGFKRIQRA